MDPNLLDVYKILAEKIARRYQGGHVTAAPAGTPTRVVQDFISDLVQLFVNTTLEFAYLSENFVHRYPEEEHELEAGYRDTLGQLGTPSSLGQSGKASKPRPAHPKRASAFDFFNPEASHDEFENLILQRALRSTYSPGFQLALMEIDPAQLKQPVLDIGCGQTGELVHYLKGVGCAAFGADRLAEPSPYLIQRDWLAMDLQPEAWGTILSHASFSSHFMIHHHYQDGDPLAYARLYTMMLAAIEPGGQLIYLPGLPFIEAYVPPECYRITRQELVSGLADEADFSSLPHSETWYVTKITRL